MSAWEPDQYLKFTNERTRSSQDLLVRISLTAPERILDVGCGPGNSTALLAARWPAAAVTGLDSSVDMLAKAAGLYPQLRWLERDISENLSDLGSFDVVFSSSVLQWIPDHDSLLPRLFGLVSPGGVLAVQLSNTDTSPLHNAVRDVAQRPRWKRSLAPVQFQMTASVSEYYDRLTLLTPVVDIWLTTYIYVLDSHEDYIEWSRGAFMRSYLNQLPSEEDRRAFTSEVLACVVQAYRPQKNGKFLFPFQRLFFVAEKNLEIETLEPKA